MIKKTLTLSLLAALIFILKVDVVFSQKLSVLQQGRPTSLRGLCVVDDKVAWVSGSKGYVACTKDAGRTWNWFQIKGYEQSDFRDIEAFSDKEAVIMSSGTPALILKTADGGLSWQVKYHNRDTSVFLDAMDFRNKYGCAMGDPINGRFVLFETFDKGASWKQRDYTKLPVAKFGEAAFAASGSCLAVNASGLMRNNELMLVSGGSVSGILYSISSGKKWLEHQLPIAQGTTSAGAFSVAIDGKHWVVVGGDYQHDHRTDSTVCYTNDGGKTWKMARSSPGFQSCVKFLSGSKYLSTGTSGTHFTKDGGATWQKVDAGTFNVCSKAKSGKLILLAGNNGRIAVFQPPKEYLIPYIKL